MKAGQGDTLQCLEVKEGRVNLTSGTYKNVNVAHCVEDGNIVVTWLSGETDTIAMVTGDDISFDCTSVEVSTGKFHLCSM